VARTGDADKTLRFGYFAELNHGVWAVIGGPLLIYLTSNFLAEVNNILTQLRGIVLTVRTTHHSHPDPDPVEWIRKRNHILFTRWGIMPSLIIGGAVLYVIGGEICTFNENHLGYVQVIADKCFTFSCSI
jgi:hypothetical protein